MVSNNTPVPIPAPPPIGFGAPSSPMMMPLPTSGDIGDDGVDRFDLAGLYTFECGGWKGAWCADEDILSMGGLLREIGFLDPVYSLLHFLCMEGPFYLLS